MSPTGSCETRFQLPEAARTALPFCLGNIMVGATICLAGAGQLDEAEASSFQGGLTRREQQVALMAAADHPDAAIATALRISVRTVQTHLARVYRKLDVAGRRELPAALSRSQALRSDAS